MTPAPNRRGGRRPGGKPKSSSRPKTNVEPLHPTAEPPDIESFETWDLHPDVQAAIKEMGISVPTPIQRLAIGPVLEGKDVIAKAETGTGKTLAFGAPMISKVDPARRTVLGLVLSPTRELAEQVHDVMEKLGAAREMRTALIVGGEPVAPQVKALQAGAQVVVGTPGRVLDLMGQGFLTFPWTEFCVLDEADKMLEIGFIDDVKKILDAANEYRQTLLFSATFPTPLLELARGYTTDPAEVATASGVSTAKTISQRFIAVDDDDKARLLLRLIESSGKEDVFLVFCDRRTDVDRLLRRLERGRFATKALHGGYDQAARFRVMSAFREKTVKCLVATDVASRGLDVVHVTHVVNYSAPRDTADYTHRIGRTGRAGREGIAITLVSGGDRRRWTPLQKNPALTISECKTIRELLAAPEGDQDEKGEERQDRDRKPREERSEKPRRDRNRDRDEERPKRPRRDREERSRDEKPRRRDRDEERSREEKPRRRDRDEGRDRDSRRGKDRDEAPARPPREEKPKRQEKPKSEPKPAPSTSSFGQGVEDSAPAPEKKPRKKKSKKKPSAPARSEEPREPKKDSTSGGFGSGL